MAISNQLDIGHQRRRSHSGSDSAFAIRPRLALGGRYRSAGHKRTLNAFRPIIVHRFVLIYRASYSTEISLPVWSGMKAADAKLTSAHATMSPWISPRVPRASAATESDAEDLDEFLRAVPPGNKSTMTAYQTPAQSLRATPRAASDPTIRSSRPQ